jgi:hypothetical protein
MPGPLLLQTADDADTNAHVSQDEIDWEFINGANGMPTWHQGSIWSNVFRKVG